MIWWRSSILNNTHNNIYFAIYFEIGPNNSMLYIYIYIYIENTNTVIQGVFWNCTWFLYGQKLNLYISESCDIPSIICGVKNAIIWTKGKSCKYRKQLFTNLAFPLHVLSLTVCFGTRSWLGCLSGWGPPPGPCGPARWGIFVAQSFSPAGWAGGR